MSVLEYVSGITVPETSEMAKSGEIIKSMRRELRFPPLLDHNCGVRFSDLTQKRQE